MGATVSVLQAIVLGAIQGVTEFLPISSSAHLILVSQLFGWPDQGLAFDMAAHVGSLAAVVAYLRSDLARLTRACAGSFAGGAAAGAADRRLALGLLVATLPVAVVGWFTQEQVATAGRNAVLIAATSILFGLLLGAADRRGRGARTLVDLGPAPMLAIGLAQALALVPGTSRSGVTITAALLLGLSREASARFSFLLAIPVGLLVAVKQVLDLAGRGEPSAGWAALAAGCVVSGLSAYLVIDWLLAWLRRRSLLPFVVYRVGLGLVIVGLALL